MKTIIFYFLLYVGLSYSCFGQNSEIDSYDVGFRYYKTFDTSRQYITNDDTTSRPLLIHHWYPCAIEDNALKLSFKNYINLIAIRDDYNRAVEEVGQHSTDFINAYLGFAKQYFNIDTSTTTQDLLSCPVNAIQNAPMLDNTFPLVIYAPSNSKSSIQNFMICETLASNGFNVISVASAGVLTSRRVDQKGSIEAQVLDMEFILKYFKDSLYLEYSDLGLFGFSTGCLAVSAFQMRKNDVKAILCLDGSNEYSHYFPLFELKDFNLNNTTTPYCILTNKHKDFSFYPYYNSIVSTQKYMFKMPHLDHSGFISYWKFFDLYSPGITINPITESYDLVNETVSKFFMTFLNPEHEHGNKDVNFQISTNEYLVKDTNDNSAVAGLLNTVLSYGIDAAILEMANNKEIYLDKEDELNILGRMFIDKDVSIAISLFKANIEIHPNSWQAYYNLGHCYKKENNLNLAKEALNRAIELQPENADILKLMEEVRQAENG